MKYRIISDIHCEFWNENPKKACRIIEHLLPPLRSDADSTLLLAGDTGSHKRRNIYAAIIAHLYQRFDRIIDIPGNHFWYGGTSFDVLTAPIEEKNYIFNDLIHTGDVTATTLWMNYLGGNPLVEQACYQGMNDYRQTVGLTIDRVKKTHEKQLAFLRGAVKPGSVVMTHHAPSFRSVPPIFQTSKINGGYYSDLDHVVEELKPALWVHGHIHVPCDYMIGETRVICNAAGYPGEQRHNKELVVEI